MAENNQLSDETKNNSTDTSSTDASSAVIGNHENAVVPHKISNHDKLVQTMVMVDGEWINVNDTNDQANMKEDMHKVNKKVVEAQKGIVEAKNTADSAVKYADSAVSASKVNSDALVAQSSAISEAKAAADDAASKAQFIKENATSEAAAIRNQVVNVANNVSSVKADVASATSDVANLKVDVQANSAAIIKTNDAVKIQSKNSSDAINELKIANGQVESIAKDAKNNATVAKQTADAATIVAQDAKSNAVVAKQTASSATIEATNATSTASKAELSVNGLTTRVDGIEGDTKKLSGRVTSTETILQQTKDQLLQKVDKSVVDQANNLISQLSSEQKIMAGQIEQKASSTELDNALTSIKKNTTAIDENSKAIKLKADATEVNNLKGTVDSHSASINLFSDQLKSMVTESKVNDIINEKGFTTQSTVQSLIDQKAGTINESITNLDAKYKAKDGVNLATKTGNVSLSGGYNSNKNIGYISLDAINDLCGKYMTVSVDVEWSGWKSGNQNRVGYELQINYDDGSTEYDGCWLTPTTANGKQRVTATYKIKNQHVQSLGKGNAYIQINCTSAKVSHLKIERGMVATPWTPAPSDNATVTQLQSVTASIDGLQSAVKNKVDQSQYTQLAGVVQTKVSQSDFNRLDNQVNVQTLDNANIDNMKTTGHYFVHNLTGNPLGGWVYVDVTGNANDRIRQDVYQDSGTKHAFRRWFGTYWTGWSTGAEESEITQLRSDINLRVKSGDLLSQINIAAGHTLIQSNKIYFDADSFVMSPNSKAFIPSAYITNINADKITTGTLDAAKFNVKNFSADNIVGGTLNGVVVKTGTNDRYFQTSKDNIYWVRNDGMSLVGNDTYLNRANGLNVADMNNIQLTTWGGASVNPDGSIVNTSGNAGHPKIVVDTNGNWDPDDPYGTKWGGGPGNSEIVQWVGNNEYTALTREKGFIVHLNDGNNNSKFSIQKDNKVGFYVGQGENGNQVNVQFAGDDSGFNIRGNFNVYGAKNSAVKTSQGDVAISAYETAEYYFGDIGEGQTGDSGIAFVGIEKLFSETVNTSIPYQVFITAYDPGNLWVDQREHDRFVVKSDRPNVKFGWEIKAKRRGYENTRLQKVN
ncbi:hypothetical protein [Limosilactobacillus reuteri]|uniref:hypothetical protein n=1 Tax=Limosilactobacillus reuteri TaxID=1598 RepID=UPI00129A8340|nr:hypothetical protein [Limosilactobacillus reuteri]MRH31643.1 hypothetical protein [Limosilactobacillus reuteri]